MGVEIQYVRGQPFLPPSERVLSGLQPHTTTAYSLRVLPSPCEGEGGVVVRNRRLARLTGMSALQTRSAEQPDRNTMHATLPLLQFTEFPALRRRDLEILQVNIGYKCNMSCQHCHVNAGPNRTEMMDAETLALIPQVLAARDLHTLDLTGGAPELHAGFRDLVRAARAQGCKVIDRCNLTILFEPGQEDLAEFLAEQRVEIVASLPCYSLDNVDKQRGKGTFDKSILGLQKLNALGYGIPGSG